MADMKNKTIVIVTNPLHNGYRRGGVRLSRGKNELHGLLPAQVQQLTEDKNLAVLVCYEEVETKSQVVVRKNESKDETEVELPEETVGCKEVETKSQAVIRKNESKNETEVEPANKKKSGKA